MAKGIRSRIGEVASAACGGPFEAARISGEGRSCGEGETGSPKRSRPRRPRRARLFSKSALFCMAAYCCVLVLDALSPFLGLAEVGGGSGITYYEIFMVGIDLVFAFFSTHAFRLLSSGRFLTAMALLGTAGLAAESVLAVLDASAALPLPAHLLCALATALVTSVFSIKCLLLLIREKLSAIVTALICCYLISVLFSMGFQFAGVSFVAVAAVVPALCLAFVQSAQKLQGVSASGSGGLCAPASADASYSRAQSLIPARPLATLALIVLVSAFVRSMTAAASAGGTLSYIGAAAAAAITALAVRGNRIASRFRFLYDMALFTMMAALFLLAQQAGPILLAADVAATASYVFFCLFYTTLLCSICQRYRLDPVWIFGLTHAITGLAFSLGTSLAGFAGGLPPFDVAICCFAAAILLALAFTLLLTAQDLRTSWGTVREEPSAEPPIARFYYSLADTCLHLSQQYGLTPREEEVLLLLAQRKTAPDIEAELFISNSTVKTHRRSIYRKLGVRTKDELLAMVGHPAVRASADRLGTPDVKSSSTP